MALTSNSQRKIILKDMAVDLSIGIHDFEKTAKQNVIINIELDLDPDTRIKDCLLYTSPSPRDAHESRMPSSA